MLFPQYFQACERGNAREECLGHVVPWQTACQGASMLSAETTLQRQIGGVGAAGNQRVSQ